MKSWEIPESEGELLQPSKRRTSTELDPAGRTDLGDDALVAFRRSRVANSSAVKDENVRNIRPFVARKERHQLALDLYRILLLRQAEADAEPSHVGIDDDSLASSECVSKNDIGGFPSDTGKLDQLLHGTGNFSIVAFDQRLAEADQALRLVAEKAGAANDVLKLLDWRIRHRGCCWISPKEQRRHHVDPLVGALRAQNRRHQELQRRFVIELAVRIGMRALESRHHLGSVRAERRGAPHAPSRDLQREFSR